MVNTEVDSNGPLWRETDDPGARSPWSRVADVATFLIGGGGSFIIKVGGDLPVADLLLLPMLPVLIVAKPYRIQRSRLGVMFALLSLWFFGQVATDIYRRSEMADWMRTDVRILFVSMNLLALAVLVGGNIRRQVIFFVGNAIGSLAATVVHRGEIVEIWKFGYASGVTTLVVVLACYFYKLGRYTVVVLLLLGMAAVHVAFDYRSPILFLFISIALVVPIVPERLGRLTVLPSSPQLRVFVLAGLALVAGSVAGKTVEYFAGHGYLGEYAQKKNEMQAESKGGLLLGGRPEILVSSRAVMDSPILGHGAWAKDWKYADMYEDLLYEFNLNEVPSDSVRETGLIPTHSHLMWAWVEGGVLGALFWIYVFVLAIRVILRISMTRPPLAPFYVYMFVQFVWVILFSPAGGVTVLPEACLLIIACDVFDISQRQMGINVTAYRRIQSLEYKT